MHCLINGQSGGGGGTVTIEQTPIPQNIVVNGDFSAEHDQWGSYAGKYSYAYGANEFTLRVRVTDSSYTSHALETQIFQTPIRGIAGSPQLIYVQAKVKAPNGQTPGYPSVWVLRVLSGETSGTWYNIPLMDGQNTAANIINDGSWHTCSRVCTTDAMMTGETGEAYDMTRIGISVGPTNTAGNYGIFKDILVVNLTETYGAGNEPSKEWCDANLNFQNTKGGVVEEITYSDDVMIVEPLTVSVNNSVYTAPEGHAYNSVFVDVSMAETVQKDVNFIDYDGRIVYSYTANEFASLTAMPTNPVHTGLVSQGWNWSLSDAKTYVSKYKVLWIGQMYATDNGETRLYIYLDNGCTSPMVGLYVDGTATVDWGDGSALSTITGTSLSEPIYTSVHNYPSAGNYIIRIRVTSGSASIRGEIDGCTLLNQVAQSSSGTINNHVYMTAIRRVELGNNLVLADSAFETCYNLESITVPATTTISNTTFGSYICGYCHSLKSFTFPTSMTRTDARTFYECYALKYVSLPNSITDVSMGVGSSPAGLVFDTCLSLTGVSIPDSVTYLAGSTFGDCRSLTSITIPSSITEIANSAFARCYSLRSIHFTSPTPPTVSGTSTFLNLSSSCKIYVPRGKLSAYTSATNYPSSSTYTYIEE